MKPDDIDQLVRLSLFADVPRDTLVSLTRGALLQRYPGGTQIIRQGEKPDFLHVLLEGSVEMIGADREGRETIVEILRPVDCFILAAVLTDTAQLMSARVVEPARLLLIPAEALRHEIQGDHRLALTMLGSLARQFRMMVREIKGLKLRNATQRLGCYLLALHEETGETSFALPVDKRRLAARLGMTPESLSRAFANLRNYGITASGRKISIKNPDILRRHCATDALIDHNEIDLAVPARKRDRD